MSIKVQPSKSSHYAYSPNGKFESLNGKK